MQTFWQDLRYATRALFKSPGFTLTALLTLGLGIGACTAIFSVVNGVLLRPLPYREDERIVTLWQNNLKNGVEREETSPANFLDWREQAQAFEAVAAAHPFSFARFDGDEPERFRGWLVTEGFFDILQTPALYGRTFLSEEYEQGRHQVVILGYGIWQRRFGGDPGIIGQTCTLNEQPMTVVGVMPPEFQFPPDREIWAPRPPRERDSQIRGASYIRVVGRLKPGQTAAQAQQDLDHIAARLAEQYPQTNTDVGAVVLPLREYLVGKVRPALLILFAAVGCVLLVACANLANLLMARATARRREFVIRAALGARRSHLIRQSLTESLLLALGGAVLGVLLASWLLDLLVPLSADSLPRAEQITLSGGVLIFTLALAGLTAILAGLLPALQSSRPDLQEALKDGGRAAIGAGKRQLFGKALVVGEMALALVLVIGAGLLVRSFVELMQVDPGFATDKALALEVQVGRRSVADRAAFFEATREKLLTLPNVQAVGVTSALPFHDNQVMIPTALTVEGRPQGVAGSEPTAYQINVTDDYFQALGVPLLQGRLFNAFDRADSPPVLIINRALAARHWANEDPLGQKVTFASAGDTLTAEIVGIVADVRPTGYDSEPRPEIYAPYRQSPASLMTFLVRTTSEPTSLLPSIKEKIREVSALETFNSIYTLDQLVDKTIAPRRFNLLLMTTLAALALVLASLGLYGLLSYNTAQRTQEIGVRLALGAQVGDVLRLVVWDGMKLAMLGTAVGVLAALGLSQLLDKLLFNISAADPLTYVAISLTLIAVALVACYVPARRATRIDPLAALRYE